jgi:hypothetical protein
MTNAELITNILVLTAGSLMFGIILAISFLAVVMQ